MEKMLDVILESVKKIPKVNFVIPEGAEGEDEILDVAKVLFLEDNSKVVVIRCMTVL
jgi:hypothetical protein